MMLKFHSKALGCCSQSSTNGGWVGLIQTASKTISSGEVSCGIQQNPLALDQVSSTMAYPMDRNWRRYGNEQSMYWTRTGFCFASRTITGDFWRFGKRKMLSASAVGDRASLPPVKFLESLINYEKIGVPIPGVDLEANQLKLVRVRKLLSKLGNPESKLKVLHVAGSKGKGSTCAMLGAMLHANGLKVGVHTSPHVHSLNERIHLAGGVGPPITTPSLHEAIETARPAMMSMIEEGEGPTFFEALVGIALRKFADEGLDMAIVEVGIGGETDATNVFDSQNLCAAVITPIAEEHLVQLGGSIESIARAKAGIMKPSRPVIVARQDYGVVKEILQEKALALGCDYISAEDSVAIQPLSVRLLDSGPCQEIEIFLKAPCGGMANVWSDRVETGLLGSHQISNIGVAARTIFELIKQGWNIGLDCISRGLKLVELPGRFQVLRVDQGSPWLLLDGAHTKESATALVETAKQVFPPDVPIALVIAMMKEKDHVAILGELAQLKPVAVYFTKVLAFGGDRCMSPGTLVAHWEMAEAASRQAGHGFRRCRKMMQASVSASIHRAFSDIGALDKNGVVCVTGSMYAVSDALLVQLFPTIAYESWGVDFQTDDPELQVKPTPLL